jgi:hypothetical protein
MPAHLLDGTLDRSRPAAGVTPYTGVDSDPDDPITRRRVSESTNDDEPRAAWAID